MKSNYISTLTLNSTPRSSLAKLQAELAKSTEELSTGMRADVSLDLGVRSDASATLRNQKANLQSMIDNNTSIATQLSTTQNGLDDLRTNAQSMLDSLISLDNTSASTSTLSNDAGMKLDSMISTLNVSDGRRFLFGGTKSGTAPMSNFGDGAQAALNTAFTAEFGMGPDDASASSITADQMTDFLDGAFAGEFDDANWAANWSGASDATRSSMISTSETITTSISANETAMRKIAMAYSMVSEFATSSLADETLQVIVSKAQSLLGEGIAGLTEMGAQIGSAEARITAVNDMMSQASDNTDTKLSTLESVDPAEAKTKVDLLTTQIEMSYSLTSQMLKLSIINYV
ncbi:MAG: hypothetical protein B7Y84_02395 [Azorhizobium sp. 32-67-21]|nr:MAG: hypothetical protein B7Y84_02395 [Azorhizobium sp. 32-67-21]